MKRSDFTTWEEFWGTDYGKTISEHARLAASQISGHDNVKKREAVFKKMMAHKREWEGET